MPKPPLTPPSSDMDGVDQDATRNTDAALATDQGSADLELARKQAKARPDQSGNGSRDERSR